MAEHNLVLKKRTHSTYVNDASNRSGKADVDLDNGAVYMLLEYSGEVNEEYLWEISQVTDAATNELWMAASSEVVITSDDFGSYRGLNKDPRAFTNIAGRPVASFLLHTGDIVQMTCAGDNIDDFDTITNPITTKFYLAPQVGSYNLIATTTAPTNGGVYLEKISTEYLNMRREGVVTGLVPFYVFRVTNGK